MNQYKFVVMVFSQRGLNNHTHDSFLFPFFSCIECRIPGSKRANTKLIENESYIGAGAGPSYGSAHQRACDKHKAKTRRSPVIRIMKHQQFFHFRRAFFSHIGLRYVTPRQTTTATLTLVLIGSMHNNYNYTLRANIVYWMPLPLDPTNKLNNKYSVSFFVKTNTMRFFLGALSHSLVPIK